MSAAAAADEGEVKCAICLTTETDRPYRLVNCRHVFCKTCLLEKYRVVRDPRCPECRQISFIAVSVDPKFGHIDLGHSPDPKISGNLNIRQKDIAEAMVCMKCFKRDYPESIVQCDKCRCIWHGLCLIEPLAEVRDEKGQPFKWTCANCTVNSKLETISTQELRASLFASAQSFRAKTIRPDPGEEKAPRRGNPGKRPTKKTIASTSRRGGGGGGGASASADAPFSGRNLSHAKSRGFFNNRGTTDSENCASVPRPSAPDDTEEEALDFDEEFADSMAEAQEDL